MIEVEFYFFATKGWSKSFRFILFLGSFIFERENKKSSKLMKITHNQVGLHELFIIEWHACFGMWNIVSIMNFSNHLINFMWTTFSERIIYEVRWINFVFQINLNINYRDSCTSRIISTSSKQINWNFRLLFFSSHFAAKNLY